MLQLSPPCSSARLCRATGPPHALQMSLGDISRLVCRHESALPFIGTVRCFSQIHERGKQRVCRQRKEHGARASSTVLSAAPPVA